MALGPGTSTLTPTMVDPPRAPLRIATVRQQFDQRAARLAAHAFVLDDVQRRMIERLRLVRLAPQRVLDVGCGQGGARLRLAELYPRAQWIGLDLSHAMLRAAAAPADLLARIGAAWRRRPVPLRVQADAGQLPIADARIDLLWSSLMLHWHPTPHALFGEFKRVLRVDGLLMFASFGPDSLREVRAAFAQGWPQARPMPFVDMHDFGDMMVAAGFATPVMDVEHLHLTYPSAQALLREVAALGGNPRTDRPVALPSGRQARAVLQALQAQRAPDGRFGLTLEVAYGHAWKPQPRVPGEAVVRLDQLRRPRAGT